MSEANARVCRYCGKLYKSVSGLHSHQASHRGTAPTVCCGKPHYSNANFLRHRCSNHGAPKLHICECGCKKAFATNVNLQTHMRRSAKQYKCEICGTVLKDKENLKDHLGHHAGTMRHVCGCGKMFRYLSSLSRHQRGCEKK